LWSQLQFPQISTALEISLNHKKIEGGCMAFSMRESQILDLLQHGLTNKEIGQALGISPHTVRDHITKMLLRHDLKARTALAALYARMPKSRPGLATEERRSNADRRGSPVVHPTFVGLHL
jgi:DNA-binding NarL/FixJ family response regulator